MDGSISFDGNSLQTFNRTTRTGIITDHIDLESLADRVMATYELAHANGTTIADINTPKRIIPVTGTIVASTPLNLDYALDAFRGIIIGKNRNLDIPYAGAVRRWIATAQTPTITRSEDKKYATFSIPFLCVQPFGINTISQYILNTSGRNAAAYTDSYTFAGTAPFQLPVISIILTAASSTGSQSITWGNNDNGQAITITRNSWAAGDNVVIDCSDPLNQKVTVNGINTDFSGAFPEFTPGNHSMMYSDTFASRTMSEIVYYNVRYA